MKYTPTVDISELIKHEEVMSHYGLGPNGALVYCMEFLEANVKWLITKILNLKDHYLIIDCPGQVHVHMYYTLYNIYIFLSYNLMFVNRLNYTHITNQSV